MALVGLALFFVGCGLAGLAIAPWFNAFLPPERRRSKTGCFWIVGTWACWWIAGWCFLHVPHTNSQTGLPEDEQMIALNTFDGAPYNEGEQP